MSDTADDTPASLTLTPGSLFDYAVTFTPKPERDAALAACAFAEQMRELGRLSPEVAPAKFTWWHEELERGRTGTPVHPVMQALARHLEPLPYDALNQLLHAAVIEANQVHLQDAESIDRYLAFRGGALYALIEATAGGSDEAFCEAAGVLHAGIEWLVAAPGQPAPHPQGAQAGVILRPRVAEALTTLRSVTGRSVTAAVLVELMRRWWPAALTGPPAPPPGPLARTWIGWRSARRALSRQANRRAT